MKEKLTLRNIIILCAAFVGLLVFCLSFAVKGTMDVEGAHITISNAVWHPAKVVITEHGHVQFVTLRNDQIAIFALPLIGAILALVAGAGAVVVALVVKDNKIAKFALLGCALLAVVGGVFMFFVSETILRTVVMAEAGSLDYLEQMREYVKQAGGTYNGGALSYILGALGILAGVAIGVAPFLPEKKLAQSK